MTTFLETLQQSADRKSNAEEQFVASRKETIRWQRADDSERCLKKTGELINQAIRAEFGEPPPEVILKAELTRFLQPSDSHTSHHTRLARKYKFLLDVLVSPKSQDSTEPQDMFMATQNPGNDIKGYFPLRKFLRALEKEQGIGTCGGCDASNHNGVCFISQSLGVSSLRNIITAMNHCLSPNNQIDSEAILDELRHGPAKAGGPLPAR